MLTWGLYDLAGGFYGPVTQRHIGSKVQVELCGERRADLRMSVHDPLAEHIQPLSRVLRCWLDDVPVFAGPIGTPVFRGADQIIEVPAFGPYHRLARSFIGQRSDGAGLYGSAAQDPYRLAQIPEGEIFWRLVAHAEATTAEIRAGVPPLGVTRGQITQGVRRDRTYEPGKEIWQAITELSAINLDFDLEPVHEDNWPSLLARLHTYTRMGTDKTSTVILEFGVGQNTASDLVWSPSAEIINRMTGVGEAPEYPGDGPATTPPRYTADQGDSQLLYGIYSAYEGLTGVTELGTVAETAAAVVSAEAFPIDFFEVTPALMDGTGYLPGPDGQPRRRAGFGVPPRFGPGGDWWLGDSFTVRGVLGTHIVNVAGRVTAATIEEVDQAGNAQVTVTAAPKVTAVVAG